MEESDTTTGPQEVRAMGWQQWAMVLGVFVALGTIYTFAVSPVRDAARSEAQTRATLDRHTSDIADIRAQLDHDRKTTADRYESLRDRIDAAGRDTAALRLALTSIQGKMDVLLERTNR